MGIRGLSKRRRRGVAAAASEFLPSKKCVLPKGLTC
jgi:hypothetical protein